MQLVDDRVLVPERSLGRAARSASASLSSDGSRPSASRKSSKSRLGAQPAPDAGTRAPASPARVELDVVPRARASGSARRSSRSCDLERLGWRRARARRAAASSQPRLRVVRVEVDDHEDHVRSVVRALAVREQLVVVDRRGSAAIVRSAAPGSRGGSGSPARSGRRRLSGRSRSQCRSSYFSESRYSSLPGSRGACSISSNAGP